MKRAKSIGQNAKGRGHRAECIALCPSLFALRPSSLLLRPSSLLLYSLPINSLPYTKFVVEYILSSGLKCEYITMEIHKAKYSGFCFGVRRAIKIAEETVSLHPDTYIKGDLVHNEKVCAQIEKKGIKKVDSLKEIPQGAVLIIKAHGEPLKTYKEAKVRNLNIVDATCPMVKDIHKKALNMEEQGYQIIIIGDKKHRETIGILGNIKEGIVIESKKDVIKLKDKLKNKIGVLCQSTQNIEKVSRIISQLVKYTEELLFINTICQTTRMRQKETENLAYQCQAVLIVGSKKSANTKRLYCLAKKINKNTFWVNASQSIKKESFMKFKSMGITGGASTPQEVLDKICGELQ